MTGNYKPYERRVIKRKRTSDMARKRIDRIMSDGKKRTLSEIISAMWDEQGWRTGQHIPTRSELRHHMARYSSEKYESGEFDIITGNRRASRGVYSERKYWCKT
tara:strand:- start:123 stop:434 length:312 start_codon:yes stop_codon:yes gene_type:complete